MSASFRSHFRSAARHESSDPNAHRQRSQTSRIPTKSGSSEGKVQHAAKLAKRVSRTPHPTDSSKSQPASTSLPRASAASTTTQRQTGRTPELSVTRPSALPSAVDPVTRSARRESLQPPPVLRTPSLVSGSSASTFDSPRSNGLRRKPSTIDKFVAQKRSDALAIEADRATMHSRSAGYNDAMDDAVFGISMPLITRPDSAAAGYGSAETGTLQQPPPQDMDASFSIPRHYTPSLGGATLSATPSTRYTESPLSHIATPSSVSSYSPAVATAGSALSRPQTSSPDWNRLNKSGHNNKPDEVVDQRLAPVRESSTSSSNSTRKPYNATLGTSRRTSTSSVPARPATSRNQSASNQISQKSANAPSERPRTTKAGATVFPELAHLNVEPVTIKKVIPPVRPSRDGTSSLSDLQTASPIVQSDLACLNATSHRRTPSLETPITTPSPSFRSRFGFSPKSSSKPSSKSNTPRIDSVISPVPSDRESIRGPTPEFARREPSPAFRGASPALSRSPSPLKTHRFGFLSRKPKGEPPKVLEKPKREPRKGPVAGTGHEGYGRFGIIRGRSGSSSTSSFARSPSTDSNGSTSSQSVKQRPGSIVSRTDSEMDDFLRERLTPVVLRGSGSNFGNPASSSVVSVHDSVNSQSNGLGLQRQLSPTTMPQISGADPAKRLSGLPKGSGSVGAYRKPTQTSQVTTSTPSRLNSGVAKAPTPIKTNLPTKSASVDSYDADVSANPSKGTQNVPKQPIESRLDGGEASWMRPQVEKKASRKWNFLQRVQSASPSRGKQKVPDTSFSLAQESRHTNFDNAAHCALLDAVEPIALEEVERLVMEKESSTEGSSSESMRALPKVVPHERRHSSLLPLPPLDEIGRDAAFNVKRNHSKRASHQTLPHNPEHSFGPVPSISKESRIANVVKSAGAPQPAISRLPQRSESRSATYSEALPAPTKTPELGPSNSPSQPRLSPVGRIPPVVSKRDRDRKLPSISFSRPFVSTQPRPSVKPPGALYNQIRELASPLESTPHDQTMGQYAANDTAERAGPAGNRSSGGLYTVPDLFSYPPRKASDNSCSSSSGNNSWIAPLNLQASQEDDIWNEYNDLMDEVGLGKFALPPASSLGLRYPYTAGERDARSPSEAMPLYYGRPTTKEPTSALPLPPRPFAEPTALSLPQQIAQLLRPSISSPLTPDTLSRFVGAYGGSNTNSMVSQARQSMAQGLHTAMPASRASVGSSYSRTSAHSRSTSLPDANVHSSHTSFSSGARFSRDSRLLELEADRKAEQHHRSDNLKLDALMTSKWLSFGRVLFSPAHHEVRLADEARVLVLDGLGSDWSYFLALSYAQATVYNLGETKRQSTGTDGSWHSLPNHRNIGHASIDSPFPFPKGFFTAVVLRFPVATTDEAFASCVSECKRVLRPGGHLEVSVLDLDLTNMGSRGRRAIRGLKTRMQQRDEKVSLHSLSDLLVRLIGRRGFEEVQRCVVGVPVAGRIPRSQDISSVSSDDTEERRMLMEMGLSRNSGRRQVSLADLLEEARHEQMKESNGSDEDMTKTVAKVGRWWYSTCYEQALLNTDKSIWSERELLRECENFGTSFRLLMCHAQKPTQTKRRTMSV